MSSLNPFLAVIILVGAIAEKRVLGEWKMLHTKVNIFSIIWKLTNLFMHEKLTNTLIKNVITYIYEWNFSY